MSVALVATRTGQAPREGAITLSLTGLSATTGYTGLITYPSGPTQTVVFTTNGSGAATITFVPQEPGSHKLTVNTTVTSTFTASF